jgi:hypothetical protein
MNITAKQLRKVAVRLGYKTKEGKKHLLIYSESGLVATVPRGRVKPGTLAAILKQMRINRNELDELL